MNVCARMFFVLALCLPSLSLGNDEGWLDIEHSPGRWVYYGHNLRIIVAMTNSGLRFGATITCPRGSPRQEAVTVWYAGDHYSTYATDCSGNFGFEDVSGLGLGSTLHTSLPLLASLHFIETARSRNRTAQR